MATFTIDSENNIVAHTGPPAGADESQSFSTARELAKLAAEWPVSRLVDTWNSFAGVAPFDDLKPVKKFTDRKAAVARIFKAIERLSRDVAPQSTPVRTERTRSKKWPAKNLRRARAQKGATESRTNKKAEVIALMKHAKGATLPEIMEAYPDANVELKPSGLLLKKSPPSVPYKTQVNGYTLIQGAFRSDGDG